MNAVRSLLLLLVLVLIMLTLLLAGATGVGALLNRLIPAIGLGTAILIAVVALTVSVHFVVGLFAQAHSVQEEMDPEELEQFVATLHRPSRRRRGRR